MKHLLVFVGGLLLVSGPLVATAYAQECARCIYNQPHSGYSCHIQIDMDSASMTYDIWSSCTNSDGSFRSTSWGYDIGYSASPCGNHPTEAVLC